MRPHRNREKTLIVAVCGLMLTALPGVTQGTIRFQNIGPGLDAPIRMPDGSLVPVGQQFYAELLAGTSPSSVTPFATAIVLPFVTPGYFGIGTPESVLPGFAPGSQPWLAVRVFHSMPGFPFPVLDPTIYGASALFQLSAPGGLGNTGLPPTPAPYLIGMQGFSLVPEPSTFALLIVGLVALVRKKHH